MAEAASAPRRKSQAPLLLQRLHSWQGRGDQDPSHRVSLSPTRTSVVVSVALGRPVHERTRACHSQPHRAHAAADQSC